MNRSSPQQPACRTFPPPPTTHTPQPHRRPQMIPTAHHSIPAEHPGLTHSMSDALMDALTRWTHPIYDDQEDRNHE